MTGDCSLFPGFDGGLLPQLRPFVVGGGMVRQDGSVVRLTAPPTGPRRYADAQLDDYHGLRRAGFPWRPPLRLSVRARASHAVDAIGGTVGFGFWNDPFTLTGGGVLAAPRAVWFFGASPPNDMCLVDGVPGRGWKAAVLDAGRYPSALLAPAAAVAVLLTRLPGLGRPVMRLARRAVRAAEAMLPVSIVDWHTYTLEWCAEGCAFWVDDAQALRTPLSPRGPLGFVTWIDNQYAIVSESGRFRFGLIGNSGERWLELESVGIVPL